MFKNEYQGGAFVEIFSAQGKNPGAKWKIFGSPSVIWKEFDKEVKSFVFILEGSSQTNRIQLPKENKQILGLIQRFLVLQIYIPLGQDFSTELLITDLGNIKRRLYLSTVHKELSSTPLHAKIPLFMIKRKIWCNLCIDLVAFTSEIFKGAVFQSLDGIIVSANCKLRKIFTLKSKPRETADKDDEPTDMIPRSCQLATDVPHVTQLLNMTKVCQTEIKFRGHHLRSAESDQFINRGGGSIRNSKSQDVCHIAFGSRVLGPPPLSGRRNNLRLSSETVRSIGYKNSQLCQQPTAEKHVNTAQGSALLIPEPRQQGEKGNIHQVKQTVPIPASAGQSNNRRACLKSTSGENTEAHCDEWIFPESAALTSDPACGSLSLLLDGDSCIASHLRLETSKDHEPDQAEETQVAPKDVFTFSSRPRSAPHGKSHDMSPKEYPFILDPREDNSVTRRDTHLEDDFYGTDSSEEEYNWRNYQPSQMSECELQMLASLRRQQNEDLEDTGAPHGLSASQVDNCNVSISTSSDDTTTWNSCLPPPVNQGRHYQKEMNPPSPSNPRDWLNMLSPPIVPPSQQPVEQPLESSTSVSVQGTSLLKTRDEWFTSIMPVCLNFSLSEGCWKKTLQATGEEDLSAEEDEEVLTLLYDPCLNCYFDPQTGKYYELV
ncbi:protein CFAP20DC isoform X6 [Peromyscus californicus insignis]|uniref:protein CFAP20DC isoform X6 n=1 Tax=Peromyscus californicus insignis TaxID=564181 RepID=UPI0022A68F5B|nr:protein CFAP20DC isoform X6 [Peromyscus californicus insignis]